MFASSSNVVETKWRKPSFQTLIDVRSATIALQSESKLKFLCVQGSIDSNTYAATFQYVISFLKTLKIIFILRKVKD